MQYTRKEIFDALTCDSSAEGCDPDWRHEILSRADPKDVAFIKREIGRHGEPEKETETRLRWEGKL